ncbi:TPA: hypothetical protein HA239_03910 [Candidatus Woesearchaeota archaeon]|nr:hypothetical protein [Candidatus Woesearchaeota archaeon]HIH41537.1 hypothetical protein [Candidatus Woesearchaeota archaeon]
MVKMKKSVFFSIMSVFIVILFVAFVELSNIYVAQETELELTRRRVNIINSVISDMEDTYFEKIIYASAKSSLIGLSDYYADGGFSENRIKKRLDSALEDVIYNGTLKDTDGNTVANLVSAGYIGANYTLQSLSGNVEEVFNDLGLEVNQFEIELNRESLRQKDPWTMELQADITYDLRDRTGLASWKGRTTKTVDITVYGLYAFDYENGQKSNTGVIKNTWKVDNSPYTEPSILSKLSGQSVPNSGLGICSPGFNCEQAGI